MEKSETKPVYLYATAEERNLLSRAARADCRTRSSFIKKAALDRASEVLNES